MKDYQHDAEEARQGRDDMASSMREWEKRARGAEADLLTLQEQLDSSNSARRLAEAERDELNDQLHGTNAKG